MIHGRGRLKNRFLDAVPRNSTYISTGNGEHLWHRVRGAKLHARRGLVWRTLATHPESLYSGRNADR